jgi:ankyrin repeat protein
MSRPMRRLRNIIAGIVLMPLLVSGAALALDSASRLADAVERRDRAAIDRLLDGRVDVNARQADGATALHWAAHWDDLATVSRLIESGAQVDAANDYGVTPLWLACTNRNAAIVERLLDAGGNANAALATGETLLMTAARTGDARIVKALLAHGADAAAKEQVLGQTALMWAAAQGHGVVTQVLLENGADLRVRSSGGFTALLFAARSGDVESARMLLDRGAEVNETAPDGSTPLLVAVASAQEPVALHLLDRGANPNLVDNIGYGPLHATVWKPSAKEGLYRPHGSPAIVQALLAHGAEPDARMVEDPAVLPGSYFFQQGLVGATPYWLAAKAGDAAVMRTLAQGGANPALANKEGITAIMVASGLGQGQGPDRVPEKILIEAVRAALALGADVNAVNAAGQTAAHGAAGSGFLAILKVLAQEGANLDVKDKRGQTPLSAAQARGATETVLLLKALGAADEPFAPPDSTPIAPATPR